MKRWLAFSLLLVLGFGLMTQRVAAQTAVLIQPGDSWAALAVRFQVEEAALHGLNPQMNPQRQPAIGTEIVLPETAVPQTGIFLRPWGNLWETAVSHNRSPWAIALRNGQPTPHRPTLYQPIFIPAADVTPRELPAGFATLEVSQLVGVPGQAIGLRGEMVDVGVVTAVLGNNEMDVFSNDGYLVGLTGTGAFFGTQQPELSIQVGSVPPWRQPWQFRDPTSWEYQQLTLTGTAAQIDQESIAEERARLFEIWEQNSGPAQWQAAFQLPISSFLEIRATYGDRKSVV